ncbi:hypothetical protein B1A_10324 [mine drainage metagenome]|uniref:DUF4214 domain-containing protein n=1 Tax=mine drainage metagenome TaxID=410659 RepID=T1C3V7_9ZZZZ
MALTANQVQQAYLAYFGRPADVIGLNYWEGQSQAAMTAGFAASPEFANMYAGMSAAAEVIRFIRMCWVARLIPPV